MANPSQVRAFFSHLVTTVGRAKDIQILAIAHMVPNTLSFAPALNDLACLAAIFAKPKSVGRPEHKALLEKFKVLPLSRDWAASPDNVVKLLRELGLAGKRVVLVDIGGYFADALDDISSRFDGELLGVMEGTENGVKRYEDHQPYRTPIITVARSPLKLPEDYLVASSLVFSIEATLRGEAEILQTRSAAVIGYGRVGSAIADILRNRGINTVVFDRDPIKLAAAAARGFQACKRLSEALSQSSLVVCATGNRALDLRGFGMLRPNCVVASVTSADDEFDLDSLSAGYTKDELSNSLTQYSENRGLESPRSFYLVAGGNAANFLHGAVIGPAIQLIEGEKIAAIRAIIDGRVKPGRVCELEDSERTRVAEIWNNHFL
jgi:adenosylhomocysteinase